MYLWLRWWMGHYSKRTWFPNCICVIVFAVKDTHTLACSFVLCEYLYCFLLGSRQVTWLPCLSLCSWLISSIVISVNVWMCVRECESWTALQPFSENYLNLMFALQTDKRRHAVGGNVMCACACVCLIAWLSLWGSGCPVDFWRASTFWPLF